ncbi:MAG: hypothetical protein FJW66_07660 [Actinobacteria bacterium]|nr:hypothetical protein [Actinomycetota bacterium]
MKRILLLSKNTEFLNTLKTLRLKNCNLILINNIEYIFHHIEEQLPAYVILNYSGKHLPGILEFLSGYPDLKIIYAINGRNNHFKNNTAFAASNSVYLENINSSDDLINISIAIDNMENPEPCSLNPALRYPGNEKHYKFLKQQVISFYSLQGGIGKTTVALNMAWALKNLTGAQILYLDLNFSNGPSDTTMKLNLPFSGGLGHYIENVSDGLKAFYSSVHRIRNFNVGFIQPPSSLYLSDRFDIDMLNELICLARKEFNIIIADVPNRTDAICLEMLNLSNIVLFLAGADSIQIMRINMFLNILQPEQKMGIIINNCRDPGPGSRQIKKLSHLSDIPVVGCIPCFEEFRKKFLKLNRINTGIIDICEEITDLVDYVILS